MQTRSYVDFFSHPISKAVGKALFGWLPYVAKAEMWRTTEIEAAVCFWLELWRAILI
jgi:hypothetical protein